LQFYESYDDLRECDAGRASDYKKGHGYNPKNCGLIMQKATVVAILDGLLHRETFHLVTV
jgi:hypothetical protein